MSLLYIYSSACKVGFMSWLPGPFLNSPFSPTTGRSSGGGSLHVKRHDTPFYSALGHVQTPVWFECSLHTPWRHVLCWCLRVSGSCLPHSKMWRLNSQVSTDRGAFFNCHLVKQNAQLYFSNSIERFKMSIIRLFASVNTVKETWRFLIGPYFI
jgi:hypothetical protein